LRTQNKCSDWIGGFGEGISSNTVSEDGLLGVEVKRATVAVTQASCRKRSMVQQVGDNRGF
jgi:hypothetical protein